MTLNRDTLVAIGLLVITGGLMVVSFDIREPDYGQLSPAAWPRAILVALGALSFLYLVQSVRQGADAPNVDAPKGLGAFISYWRNVLWCFGLFLVYLLIMPYLGILLAGMLFVFALLSALGGLRSTPLHLAITVIAFGGMWAIFAFALRVPLPKGDWTGF